MRLWTLRCLRQRSSAKLTVRPRLIVLQFLCLKEWGFFSVKRTCSGQRLGRRSQYFELFCANDLVGMCQNSQYWHNSVNYSKISINMLNIAILGRVLTIPSVKTGTRSYIFRIFCMF